MKTIQILNLMKILSWVIFIGLCLKAGAITISFFLSLFSNGMAAENLYLGLNLSKIYELDKTKYINVVSFIITIAMMKAYLFYLVVSIFTKLNLNQPFKVLTGKLVSKISYVALSIGIVGIIANRYTKLLMQKGLDFRLNFEGQEFLFLAGILFIIALIFKRGIEIQQENDLTI